MPINLYGPNDNFNLKTSHVVSALIRKIHEAKINQQSEAIIWGSGRPKRDFLYSEDLADACVFLLENIDFKDTYKADSKEIRNTHINIGTGIDISIKALAELIKNIIGFTGSLSFDTSKPDGTMLKLTDTSKLHALGWRHRTELGSGIKKVYQNYTK